MSAQQASFSSTIDALLELVPAALLHPTIGIVCGSGLSTLASSLRDKVLVNYELLPGFAKSTEIGCFIHPRKVHGHKSELAFGVLGPGDGVPVVAMLGRLHPYEGHSLASVVYPIRLMAKLGVKNLLITNAAGALNPDLPVGTIVVIQDHIALPNLTGLNPLLGPQTDLSLPRFLPLSNAYSRTLRRLAFLAANDLSLPREALAEGTYAWVSGPTYETAAEGRFLRAAGADVVGMSTIPEMLAAREMGVEVAVLSLVTNAVVIPEGYRSIREEVEAELAGRETDKAPDDVVSHEEVLQVGKQKAEVLRQLVERIVELVPLA